MGHTGRLRAIVCDDDTALRGVLTRLITEFGYRVVEEVDTADMALDAVERIDADVVLIDITLRAGAGERLISRILEQRPSIDCVVFSGNVEDPAALLEAGAAVVIEKPDFRTLTDWLESRHTVPAAARPPLDRRCPTHPPSELEPPPALSPSGLEPWVSFDRIFDHLCMGDALLCLDVLEAGSLADAWDAMFVADHRLSLAHVAGMTLREGDRMSATSDGVVVCLLLAGLPGAPSAVFARIEAMWDHGGFTGTPVASFAHVRLGDPARDLLARALLRLDDGQTSPRHPLRLA